MSAILSASDLNDFIAPGVACIKPIEPLSSVKKSENQSTNPYEVTTEEQVAAANPAPPAQISLTDCLACSGCVTSAEAVLVSLQSHGEVLETLDKYKSWSGHAEIADQVPTNGSFDVVNGHNDVEEKIFVATISPQVRASVAATFRVSEREAGYMIEQLLSGPKGLAAGGKHGSHFAWMLDSNVFREIALVGAAEEVALMLSDPASKVNGDGSALTDKPKRPVLTSACPGWICYAEKTHPHVLPHISRLKSPQALAGTLVKSVLAKKYSIDPSRIWHLAVMPCFDKKLEASRSELTSVIWSGSEAEPVRDVDCVITARELISLAAARNIEFSNLPRTALSTSHRTAFPEQIINSFLFHSPQSWRSKRSEVAAGTSGGYLYHILRRIQAEHPGSIISVSRGRNADVVEYTLSLQQTGEQIIKLARYYGFRNIQNLVRKLKPARTSRLLAATAGTASSVKAIRPAGVNGTASGATRSELDYAYVEVMACPGGCTNGGGQIRAGEVNSLRSGAGLPDELERVGPAETREWLASVDEAYFSASDSDTDASSLGLDDQMNVDMNVTSGDGDANLVDGISRSRILSLVEHWSSITGVAPELLIGTSYRKVVSDVGKKVSDVERVAGLASSIGGGW